MEDEIMEKVGGLKKLYSLAKEISGDKSMADLAGDKSIADLAIEKLQLEAAGLEVEATTSALRNIADLSWKLLVETHTASSLDDLVFEIDSAKATYACSWTSECLKVAQREVLIEQLVGEAGIIEQLVGETGISSTAD